MKSDYELMQQLNSTNIDEAVEMMGWIDFADSTDSDTPSKKFGMGVFVGIFLGFIVFSAFLVVVIIWISKKFDDNRATKKQDRDQRHRQDLQSNLICKPWCPEGASESPTRDSSTEKSSSAQDVTADSLSCLTVAGEYDSGMEDVELQENGEEEQAVVDLENAAPPPQENSFQQKDGCVCGLCHEEYQPGQPVYESNNPQCRHEFHKVCLDKWLEFQNTCPACNQPYALHTA